MAQGENKAQRNRNKQKIKYEHLEKKTITIKIENLC